MLIMLGRLDDPAVLPDEPLFTAITLAELAVGPLVSTSDHERAARQAHLQQSESDFDALPFDAGAARAFGRVAALLRQLKRTTVAQSIGMCFSCPRTVSARRERNSGNSSCVYHFSDPCRRSSLRPYSAGYCRVMRAVPKSTSHRNSMFP